MSINAINQVVAISGYLYYTYTFLAALFPKFSFTFHCGSRPVSEEIKNTLTGRLTILNSQNLQDCSFYIVEGLESPCVGYSGVLGLTDPLFFLSTHFEDRPIQEKDLLLAKELSHIRHGDSIKKSFMILTASLLYTLYLRYFLSQIIYFGWLATISAMYLSSKMIDVFYSPLEKWAFHEATRVTLRISYYGG